MMSSTLEKQAALLEGSPALFQQFLEALAQAVIVSDADGTIVLVNEMAERITGYRLEELRGESIEILVPDSLRSAHQSHRTEYARNPRSRAMGEGVSLSARRKNGSTFPVEISLGYISLEDTRYVLATMVDISLRKELEAEYLHAQRLESLAILAGSITHDFSNILSVVNACAEILLTRMSAEDPLQDFVRRIKEAGFQGAHLTRQLLSFARKTPDETLRVGVDEAIRSFGDFLEPIMGKGIQLQLELHSSGAYIMANAAQLEQIFMNLAVNARDAMVDGGIFTIATTIVVPDQNGGPAFADHAAPHICITISDSGCGMSPQTLARIFEPFFTTKSKDKGTGLGLSTVSSLVKEHGGTVKAQSIEGEGATFTITLPLVE